MDNDVKFYFLFFLLGIGIYGIFNYGYCYNKIIFLPPIEKGYQELAVNFSEGTLDNMQVENDKLIFFNYGYGEFISNKLGGNLSKWIDILPNFNLSYSNELLNNCLVDNEINMSKNLYLIHFNNELKDSSCLSTRNVVPYMYIGEEIYSTNAIFNNSFNFTGRNCISLDDKNTLSNYIFDDEFSNRTIELWFNSFNNTGLHMLYEEGGRSNGMNIYINNSYLYGGVWSDHYKFNGYWISYKIKENRWYHVVLIFNNGLLKLYLNDNLIEDIPLRVNKIYNHPKENAIGCVLNKTKIYEYGLNDEVNYFFDGLIDEFAVYNRTLSDEEINTHYLRGIFKYNIYYKTCNLTSCNNWKKYTTEIDDISNYLYLKINFSSIDISKKMIMEKLGVRYNTAPFLIVFTSNISNSNLINLNFTIYDEEELSTYVNVSFNNNLVWNGSLSNLESKVIFLHGEEGLNNLTFNLSNSYFVSYPYTIYVNSKPTIKTYSPGNNVEINGKVYFVFDVVDNEENDCYIYVNNKEMFSFSDLFKSNATVSYNFEEGSYEWYVSCVDKYGLQTNSSVHKFYVVPIISNPNIIILNLTDILGNKTTNITTPKLNETNITTKENKTEKTSLKILTEDEVIEKEIKEGKLYPKEISPIYDTKLISFEEVINNDTVPLKEGKEVVFNFKDDYHSVSVLETKKNYAVVLVSSEPIKLNLSLGEVQNVDVDGDGNYDLRVKLVKIVDNVSYLEIEPISDIVNVKGYEISLFELVAPVLVIFSLIFIVYFVVVRVFLYLKETLSFENIVNFEEETKDELNKVKLNILNKKNLLEKELLKIKMQISYNLENKKILENSLISVLGKLREEYDINYKKKLKEEIKNIKHKIKQLDKENKNLEKKKKDLIKKIKKLNKKINYF